MLFLVICIGIFLAFDLSAFTANQNLLSVCVLILSFWLASEALVYLLEPCFSEPSMGQLFFICANVMIGMITLVTSLILQMLWWIPVSNLIFNN